MTIEPGHLDALNQAISGTTSRTQKRRLREVLLLVTQEYSKQLHQHVKSEFAKDLEAPLIESDIESVDRLMTKGIIHNGVVPELSATEVARSVSIVTSLLVRANAASLTQDDLSLLEWMFDQAAQETEQRRMVRKLEATVRLGLGIEQRPVWDNDPQRPLS